MIPSIFEQIHDRLTADSEAESEPEGYLSYRAEWHAAAWGFTSLFLAMLFGRWEIGGLVLGFLLTGQRKRSELNVPYPKQIAKESAYALGHGLVGAILGLAVNTVLL